eukprot:42538-Pleurochrysis_carterae.AAC.1
MCALVEERPDLTFVEGVRVGRWPKVFNSFLRLIEDSRGHQHLWQAKRARHLASDYSNERRTCARGLDMSTHAYRYRHVAEWPQG